MGENINTFRSIQNKKELYKYLLSTDNSYTRFILNQLSNNAHLAVCQDNLEKHHIIPLHMGGPSCSWNLVILSYEDHTRAHALLYECYGSRYDKAVVQMRAGLTGKARREIAKANVEKARVEKTGRFNPELQRSLGSRPKKQRKPFAKTYLVLNALEHGMVWRHKDGSTVIIPGKKTQSPIQVASILSKKSPEKLSADFIQKAEKSYLYSGIVKILVGWRDPKTKKSTFSVGPWRLLGLLL